jgi:hypothetical protein
MIAPGPSKPRWARKPQVKIGLPKNSAVRKAASFMDDNSLELLLGAIAEQQYRFHNLLTLLVEKKIIGGGEMDAKFNEKEKFQFTHDLLEHLVATGLKISGSSPSAASQESQAASAPEATGASDPRSGTRS